MSAAEAIVAVHAAGVHLGIGGGDLVLRVSAPLPDTVLDLLSPYKPDGVAPLRPVEPGWRRTGRSSLMSALRLPNSTAVCRVPMLKPGPSKVVWPKAARGIETSNRRGSTNEQRREAGYREREFWPRAGALQNRVWRSVEW